jgi:hypothetical protein
MEIKWANENIDGYIYLLNNPLKNPPSEIIKLGKDAINRHFNRIEKEGIDYIYEAKLILVGDGDSGKTSLQTRLINPKSTLPKKDSRTRGIKIHDWNFKTSKNNAQIAHIWDFGGQDVYYPVHRFFLTENSVFVLLASTRQPHHNFDYWIPTIYQFGGQSPIIIGQTCHDGNKTPWNDLSYYLSSPNFNIIKTSHLPYYELNLPKRNEGLKTIKQIIINQIQNLPHYGKGVPNSWIPIRNIISKKSETAACITFAEFREICINSNKNYFVKLIDIEDCAKFFHLIGVLLWYYDNEELKDWVILQPEWAMNAVYKIIDDDEIQKRRGNIIDRDFHRLWNSDQYLGKHFILKRMLEVFKIAFQKKHIKTDYLIPARLLSMPTEKEWKNSSSELRLEYRYEFMPKGMVNQLSAELSRYIISDALVWNNAVIFNSTNNTAQCQVKEDFYNRKIIIKANGREARDLIILVMNSLKDITDGYKGVKPEILVPCLCKKCKKSEKISTYLYDDLVRWSKKSNNAAVTCNESDERITIDKLLYNVGLDKPLNDGKGDFAIKKISLFLASSLKLQDDRDQFEIFINRENNQLIEERLRLELKTCDNDLEYISDQGTQNKYDQSIKNSDISIFLIHAHLGKFTYKEFKIAFEQFKKTGKPYIYTYFKDSPIHPSTLNEEDINRRFQFEEELNLIGHYFSRYENFSDLKYQFKEQLTKILKDL